MRTVEYRGTLLALTSISHGGIENGTTQGFRRETFVLPDGKVFPSVPVISGGSVRGSLRRLAAKMTQHALAGDGGRLPFPAVHALRTGGALRETRSGGEVLTGERQARLRDLLPHFGVFGLAGGGRIMSGRLCVDKPLPVAAETAYLAEHYATEITTEPPSIWSVIQRETYTRIADVEAAAAQPYIETAGDRELAKGSGNMIWTHETIVPGTRLFHSLVLEDATAIEVSFFDDLVRRWGRDARVGGQVARGHGRVHPEYARTVRDVLGDEADTETGPCWTEHIAEHREEAIEALGWL